MGWVGCKSVSAMSWALLYDECEWDEVGVATATWAGGGRGE
jgi:hypothetical protein